LIEAAKPGDISVFVFAGHGSRMRNEGSDEADKMDQTLVPADSENGVPDIRDKELARLYRKAAEKRILLTVIADSCHSGGVSRGLGRPAITRDAVPDPHVVNDPPDIDPKTGKPYTDRRRAVTSWYFGGAGQPGSRELEEQGSTVACSVTFQRCLTEERRTADLRIRADHRADARAAGYGPESKARGGRIRCWNGCLFDHRISAAVGGARGQDRVTGRAESWLARMRA
jgi:hypothetical protein